MYELFPEDWAHDIATDGNFRACLRVRRNALRLLRPTGLMTGYAD